MVVKAGKLEAQGTVDVEAWVIMLYKLNKLSNYG